MQVVILAGGKGTRIQSVTTEIPKALIPVAGRPFVDYQLGLLKKYGLKDVLFCIGHLGDKIESYLGNGASRDLFIHYVHEDADHLLGTGGALVHALDQLEDRFLLMYGDAYLPVDYGQVVQASDAISTPAMMCVFRNEGKWDTSNVRIDGDRVVFYSKAAPPKDADYIDYGLAIYSKEVIARYKDADMPLDLASIQEDLVAEHAMGAFEVDKRFYEVGKPEGLADMEAFMQSGNKIDE